MKRLLVIAIALLCATVANADYLDSMAETQRRATERHDAQMERDYAERSARLRNLADENWRDMMEDQRSDAIRNELMHMNNR